MSTRTLYNGSCNACGFQYSIADRLPNHCPECGVSLVNKKKRGFTFKTFFDKHYEQQFTIKEKP